MVTLISGGGCSVGDAAENPGRELRSRLVRNPLAVVGVAAVVAAGMLGIRGIDRSGILAAAVGVILVVVSATDLERRLIPNRVILPATAALFVVELLVWPERAAGSALWGAAAGLLFLLPSIVSPGAIGMGDVKLAVFLGLALRAAVLPALVLGCLAMMPVAIAIVLRKGLSGRKQALPFAPFLSVGALAILMLAPLVGGNAS